MQKVCQEADNQREAMKWLVKTLDNLTSNRSDHEAITEQKHLEQLITRYKNLIPTIEITMTKTEIYSKSYTYLTEVREVCTLLRKVRDQSTVSVAVENPEKVKDAVKHQEIRITQLEEQRANIVSMLQRGKDLLKDQHVPTFISSEVQQLESSWNDAYGESMEALKNLKLSEKLWNAYDEQKREILRLIAQAEEDLRNVRMAGYYDASKIQADLQRQEKLSSSLRKDAGDMLKKLRSTQESLCSLTSAERQPQLTIEVQETKKKLETTLERVEKKVVELEEYNVKWNTFHTKLSDLKTWTYQSAPQSIANIDSSTSPEERVRRTDILQKHIHEKIEILKILERESRVLVPIDDHHPQAIELKDNIKKIRNEVETLNKSIVDQRDLAAQNLQAWKEYEIGIQKLKPWIEEAESKVAMIGAKPSTLTQATEMLRVAKEFERKCDQYLPQLQDLTEKSQHIEGKGAAPDEVDAVNTRWNAVHDVAVQTTTKLDKLVSSWNTFEQDAKQFNEWLQKSEKASLTEPNVQTPEIGKLEQELIRIKEFNKDISDHQAQLISLTQVSDHISHGLSIEGATNLKGRVSEMKTRVNKLADTVRHQINKASDALLARQEFQIKITDFENWMSRLRSNTAEINNVDVDNVDTSLQAVHAFLQEHSEKQPNFTAIYDEVKSLTASSSPQEAAVLDDIYSTLAEKYKTLEDDLQRKKKDLEKWIELLNWQNEASAQLSHCKYQSEARKPTITDLESISSELQATQLKINSWKEQVPMIESTLGVHVRDKQGRPLIISDLVNNLEAQALALRTELAAKRDKLESLGTKWDNFRKLQQKINEEIVSTQTTLQKVTYDVDTCDKLSPTIERINDLMQQHQQCVSEKDQLHREGDNLLKEDQRSMTNIQVVLSSVDSNWEKVNELLYESKKKHVDMENDWRQYQEAKEKLSILLEESRNLCQSAKEVPNDITQATVILDKYKRELETLKRGTQFLEKMEMKGQQILKDASLMPSFKTESITTDVSKIRQEYQKIYSNVVEKTQIFETQVIIWKQLDEAKYELTRWLSDTNEAITSAIERLSDAEAGQARLAKYYEELPSYQVIRQGIATKTEQLIKLNNNASIPTLSSLNQLLDDQFKVVKESAEKLESLTTNLSDKEKSIRQKLKKSSDLISKIREDIIKCDDLTGENTKILSRINKCQELKQELEKCDYSLSEINEKLTEMTSTYPSISKSSLPKELQALQLRRDGVASHADKVNATLVAFLTKLYHEKFGALQRMVTVHKEKIAWCEPEQSSDKYNLEVKMASLKDIAAGIADCEARKTDSDNFLKLLETVESFETMSNLYTEREKVANDLDNLKTNYEKIKNILENNIALWQRYESTSENVSSWLKEMENKIRLEGSSLIDPSEIETKIKEIVSLRSAVMEYQKELTDLAALGDQITSVSPESRVGQYVGHLNARYQTIQKFLNQHLKKLEELKDTRDQYKCSVKELEDWLTVKEKQMNAFDEIIGPKPISFYQNKLKELKVFNEKRDEGQAILNRTIEAGENLYSKINSNHREIIRADLRNLRNRVDALADRASATYKKIESDMMHRSSFEDKYTQVKRWVIDAQSKLSEMHDLQPTLQEKKLALHSYRAIAQDVGVHKNILQQLEERLGNAPDDESSDMLSNIIEAYDKLAESVEGKVNVAEKHVANHEAYLQTFDKMRDWINIIVSEATPMLDDLSTERDAAKAKINLVENTLQQKDEGDRLIDDCNQQLNIILEQTSIAGHPALLKSFDDQKKIWQDFLKKCQVSREKLNSLFDQWSEFQKMVEALENWTKQMETQVKDQSLKSTQEAKKAHLKKLKSLEEEISAKGPEFNAAIEKSQNVEADSELVNRVSRQSTKYQAIKNQVKEAVTRYEQFVKEHEAFNEKYNHFLNWINEVQDELKKHSEIVGDLSVLQNRQKSIRNLGDTRTKENARFESIIDLGEKLYAHTSPEGREIVRQQLRNLRTLWDGFSEDLQSATQKLDQCLMQFAEFSLSQEQLTAWLRDVERAMHQHTELKSTLEEKRAQLQNHKIMHQEIMSHQTLVESVCDKAQQLVDQTKDTSLNVYLQSIKQLFQNIVSKSRDLLDNLEDCAEKHNRFNLKCIGFNDWLALENEMLNECYDVSGERSEISRRLATLAVLSDRESQGKEMLQELKDLASAVEKSTAPKGQEAVKKELSALEDSLKQHQMEIG